MDGILVACSRKFTLYMPCRGRPTDVYALGACLFTFVYGRIPFNAPNVFKLFQLVQTEELRFPEDVTTSDELKDLLNRMLAKARVAIPSLVRVKFAF